MTPSPLYTPCKSPDTTMTETSPPLPPSPPGSSETAPDGDLLAKIRAQFDRAPYPRIPIEQTPAPSKRYFHSAQTAFYRRDGRMVETDGMAVLDVGCGSGFGTMALALANEGATVVGTDLSPASVDLAAKRFAHHGLSDRAEFAAIAIDDLAQLGRTFDYINCDELLYLQPDPAASLAAMAAALKPHGIIRANLHSRYQRRDFFKVQALAQMLGLLDDNPGEFESEALCDLFESLHDTCLLKARSWNPDYRKDEERMMMNFLFQGDRGFTVPEMADAIEGGGLEFVSMLQWQAWNLMDLFKDPDNLPSFLEMGLPMASDLEKLAVYELLHSQHRLLDFWCSFPGAAADDRVPVEAWEPETWEASRIALHPCIPKRSFGEALEACWLDGKDLNMNEHLELPWGLASVSSSLACILAPLLNGPQTFETLVALWRKNRPIDPVSLDPVGPDAVVEPVRYLLSEFVKAGYLFAEPL